MKKKGRKGDRANMAQGAVPVGSDRPLGALGARRKDDIAPGFRREGLCLRALRRSVWPPFVDAVATGR